MNIYQLARERSARFDERTLARPAEIAIEAKKMRNRKWREANPDKVETMRMKERKREKTPERKAMHKAWAQSPARKNQRRLGGEHVLALMGITLKVRIVA